MKLAFDLISDLHVETWDAPIDWSGQATSMMCVVAGDISRDRAVVVDTLRHLGECYRAVFYIDGNDEHRYSLDDIGESYKSLAEELEDIPNVTYLQDNVCIVDGVAFLGTNAWWTYDLDAHVDYDQTKLWFQDRYQTNRAVADAVEAMALQDFAYLAKSIQRLQTHRDVKKIVVVTHTVPMLELINHDLEIADTYRINTTGNSHILKALNGDTENKVAAWCFGHYHGNVDTDLGGSIRYVNNCRGRGNTPWSKSVYYPKRIEISV
jgi:hypothetical protein